MRRLIDRASAGAWQVRALARPVRLAGTRLRALGWPEGLALVIAVAVFVGGPAAVFGYERWMDRGIAVVHARQWEYAPRVLHATAGVPLRIRIESEDVVHGFKIDGLNVSVTELIPGKAMEVVVTPPKPGTYYYECTTYCGRRHSKMFGQLIVTGR